MLRRAMTKSVRGSEVHRTSLFDSCFWLHYVLRCSVFVLRNIDINRGSVIAFVGSRLNSRLW